MQNGLEATGMKFPRFAVCWSAAVLFALSGCPVFGATQVLTDAGTVEGTSEGEVRIFKGIPYAAPPVGDLRWKPPQPVLPWTGVRPADKFGPAPLQISRAGDMFFRDAEPSEDCLTLNVWTPAPDAAAKLPVMVWIYGGGFMGGASSEPRQDGANLAKKGVVVVSMNYRLGIFGFFTHPELAAESPHGASGNYGLLDQTAALDWVQRNIAAFGGDPKHVTIFGESAGSMSVSAQMASPLSKNLFQGAIGQSGAVLGRSLDATDREQHETDGVKFAESVGAESLAALRAKPADELVQASKAKGMPRFGPVVDGWFFPKSPADTFAAGEQAHVPLLAGWNAHESGTPESNHTTPAAFTEQARQKFGEEADKFLALYPAATDAETHASASAFAGDQFIAFGTWKWLEAQNRVGGLPVYRYRFDHAPPSPAGQPSRGAHHAADIEYVFDNLASKDLPFVEADRHLADLMATYWTNFAKTGNPNGPGLPTWPRYEQATAWQVMHLDLPSKAAPDDTRDRDLFLMAHPFK